MTLSEWRADNPDAIVIAAGIEHPVLPVFAVHSNYASKPGWRELWGLSDYRVANISGGCAWLIGRTDCDDLS